MANIAKLKPIILGCAGLAIIWGIYTFAGSANLTADATLRAEEVRAKADKLDQDLLGQLRDMDQLTLDGTLFASPEWKQLVDYSQPLGQPVRGRPDPFARIATTPQAGE